MDLGDLTDKRFNEYGDTPQAAGWSDKTSQLLRLEKILELLNYQIGDEVLDLGGGSGAMLTAMSARFDTDGDKYYCMDLSKEAQIIFRNKFPNSNYILDNFYSCILEKKFDWTVCSGALNYNLSEDNFESLNLFIEKYFDISRKGVIFNFIHDCVDYKEGSLSYYPLDQVIKTCKKYTRFISVHSDYSLFEATVALYKRSNC